MTGDAAKIARILGMNVEESEAAGLCQKIEALICSLETPLYCQMTRQSYKRDGDRIILDGPPEITVEDGRGSSPALAGRFYGRFMSFWPHQAQEAPR
jgi:hypothetical protein